MKKALSPAQVLKVEVEEEEDLVRVYILPTERAKAV
jgi:transcription antitermination factor NusA-like protein